MTMTELPLAEPKPRKPEGELILKVCARECTECLFGPNSPAKQRRRSIIAQCKRDQVHFQCHRPTMLSWRNVQVYGRRVSGKELWVCAGWFRRYGSRAIALAKELGLVWFVDPDTAVSVGREIPAEYQAEHKGAAFADREIKGR